MRELVGGRGNVEEAAGGYGGELTQQRGFDREPPSFDGQPIGRVVLGQEVLPVPALRNHGRAHEIGKEPRVLGQVGLLEGHAAQAPERRPVVQISLGDELPEGTDVTGRFRKPLDRGPQIGSLRVEGDHAESRAADRLQVGGAVGSQREVGDDCHAADVVQCLHAVDAHLASAANRNDAKAAFVLRPLEQIRDHRSVALFEDVQGQRCAGEQHRSQRKQRDHRRGHAQHVTQRCRHWPGVVAFQFRQNQVTVVRVTRSTRVSRSSIAVIGGGAAGSLTAARLIDEAGRRHRRIEITLIEPRGALGRGVAYSTNDNRHLLNVPVRKMTAYPEDAEHFARWLEAHDGKAPDPCDYVPRGRYGQYLAHVLEEAQRRTPWAELFHVRDRAVGLSYDGDSCRIELSSGAYVEVEAVVLAIGHLGPELSWVPDGLRDSSRFIDDPWSAEALRTVDPDADVLVVGTGLTMVDTVRVLDRPGRVVHATSRHGIMPHRHIPGQPPVMEAPELSSPTPTLSELHGVMAFHQAKAIARYGDWRPAIDSIRAMTQRLWAGFTDDERADFLRYDARWWDAARHRIPPQSATAIDVAKANHRLELHTAHVERAIETTEGLTVVLSNGETLRVGAVINCAGPCGSPAASSDPLVRSLIGSGIARSGPLGIGFDTTSDGQLLDDAGTASAPVWTLSSLRRGTLWESTAMPEIREQAAALVPCVLGPRATRDHRPSDRYGLALSTTPEAAAAWNRALAAICSLESGAEISLREAVSADPGFAVGHAALALLGHEWAAPVDVDASLRAAVDTAQFRGDARERSFVQAVVSRLTGDAAAGDRDLLRHLSEYPLDALAVSMALPTIAFSGLTQPVAESWALADRLALSYGSDWWFAGMLAFVRQEQSRWEEAQHLAQYSLAASPNSGHAAHALTHVFYETGDHEAGLRWLDRWIDEHGVHNEYGVHFSWHAALHELALDDGAAVRRRYDAQLAPPTISGPRALVDSASLVWRSHLVGAWPDPLPVDEILAGVPSCLLDHPGTAFAAMHAAVALAAAGDTERLNRLKRFAADFPDPTYPEVIVPLCEGLAAHVNGDSTGAAERLAIVVPELSRLGGSAAQQEVIAETLVHALVASGQDDAARQILEVRLERRPSRCDQRRLASLPQ